MAPAEMARRNSSEKSTFAATCSLLSQYIKENGSIANLDLGLVSPLAAPKVKSEVLQSPTTFRLLPGASVKEEVRECGYHPYGNVGKFFPQRAGIGPSNEDLTEEGRKLERAPLTIFYNGKVLVFDDYPADKARDLMRLASRGTSTMQNSSYMPLSTSKTSVMDRPTFLSNQKPELAGDPAKNSVGTHNNLKTPVSDLPIARKSSLKRFIEKRKDRISVTSPYKVNYSPGSPVPVKVENTELWLNWGQ